MYLRAYRREDFEAVYALDRVCFAPRFRFSRAMMRQVVGTQGAVVVLACEEADHQEVLLGFCAADSQASADGQGAGYVATLDVDPVARRRGVGRLLMGEVERQLSLLGATAMMLHVYAGNTAAVQLYESLGYVRVGQEPGLYGVGFDAYLYQKGLRARAL